MSSHRIFRLASSLGLCLIAGTLQAQQPEEPRFNYKVGRAYLYKYRVQSKVLMNLTRSGAESNPSPKQAVNQQDMLIPLELQPVGVDEAKGSTLLKVAIGIINTSGANGGIKLDIPTRMALSEPVYFEQSREGKILKVYRKWEERGEISNFKRSLIEAFQVDLSESGRSETGALSGSGSLTRVRKDGRTVLRKAWTEADMAMEPASKVRSLEYGKLRGERITTFNEKEGVIDRQDLSIAMDVSKAAERANLHGYAVETRASTQGSLEYKGSRLMIFKPVFLPFGFEQITLEPDNVDIVLKPGPIPTSFGEALRLMRRDRHAAARIGDALQQKGPKLQGYLDLVSALAQEGSSLAQAVLVRNVLPTLGPDALRRALNGLVQVKTPRLETLDAVLPLLDHGDADLRRSAATALGSLTGRLGERAPEQAQPYLNQLHGYLQRPWDDMDLMIALAALGNAGMPESFAFIAPYTSHTESHIRREAVDALRKFRSDRANGLLLERLEGDSSPSVRHKASRILGERMPLSEGIRASFDQHKAYEKVVGTTDFQTRISGQMFSAKSPSYLEVSQDLNTRIWGTQPHVSSIELVTENPSRGRTETFCNAYLQGNKVYSTDRLWVDRKQDPCETHFDETFDSGPFDLGELSQTFPVYENITITVKGTLNGQVGARIAADASACDPNNVYTKNNFDPVVTLNGTIGVSIGISGMMDIGISLSASVTNGKMPTYTEINIKNEGKDWSGALKVDASADAGMVEMNADIAGQPFKVFHVDIPAFSENLIDYVWP